MHANIPLPLFLLLSQIHISLLLSCELSQSSFVCFFRLLTSLIPLFANTLSMYLSLFVLACWLLNCFYVVGSWNINPPPSPSLSCFSSLPSLHLFFFLDTYSAYLSSIIIGADGAYSAVRQNIYKNLKAKGKLSSNDAKPLGYNQHCLGTLQRLVNENNICRCFGYLFACSDCLFWFWMGCIFVCLFVWIGTVWC